jgi:hypothetical protein
METQSLKVIKERRFFNKLAKYNLDLELDGHFRNGPHPDSIINRRNQLIEEIELNQTPEGKLEVFTEGGGAQCELIDATHIAFIQHHKKESERLGRWAKVGIVFRHHKYHADRDSAL